VTKAIERSRKRRRSLRLLELGEGYEDDEIGEEEE